MDLFLSAEMKEALSSDPKDAGGQPAHRDKFAKSLGDPEKADEILPIDMPVTDTELQ